MRIFLLDTKARGYRSVYFVRAADLMLPEVKKALQGETRCRLVELKDAALLSAVVDWLRSDGGLSIWATHYGTLERIEV